MLEILGLAGQLWWKDLITYYWARVCSVLSILLWLMTCCLDLETHEWVLNNQGNDSPYPRRREIWVGSIFDCK